MYNFTQNFAMYKEENQIKQYISLVPGDVCIRIREKLNKCVSLLLSLIYLFHYIYYSSQPTAAIKTKWVQVRTIT